MGQVVVNAEAQMLSFNKGMLLKEVCIAGGAITDLRLGNTNPGDRVKQVLGKQSEKHTE